MSLQQPHTKESAIKNHGSTLDVALPLLLDLTAILESEQQILMSPVPNGLDDLLENKQMVLDQLSAIESPLLEVLSNKITVNPDKSDYKLKILELLKSSQQLNQENNALANLGMKNLRHSINALHSAMQIESTEMYYPGGRSNKHMSKRKIGEA